MTEEIHFKRKITDNKTIGTTDMHVYENVSLYKKTQKRNLTER
jgi:hypothetical protein